jgi:integrase
VKPSTFAATKSDVRATILPYWGAKVLADVRKADVQAWVSGMGKAARTVDTIYGRFRSFLNWCVTEGRITASPAKKVNLPQGVKREQIYLTVAEVERLAGAIKPHYRDLVWFLATTGLRFGEAAELRTKDIDMRRRRIRVARSITDVDGRMVIGPPKSGKERDVPMTGFIAGQLQSRLEGKGRMPWCSRHYGARPCGRTISSAATTIWRWPPRVCRSSCGSTTCGTRRLPSPSIRGRP